MPCGKFMLLLLRVISVVPQHNGIIPKNYSTVFRHCPRIRLLGLSFNQCRLYPHIYHFNLPFGRSLTVGWLMALPTCYVPLWGFPLRLAVVNGHFKHLPSRLPKRHSSNSLYGRTRYSSPETSVAYTALCVPPSPIQTSLYLRFAALARLIDSICARSLSVSPSKFCIWSNLFWYFRWSSSILQSELLIIVYFTIGLDMMSSTSCVTTTASPKNFLTVLKR